MTKYVWPLATGALALLAGAFLIVWPFALHWNHGGGWTLATQVDVWSGVGVVVVSLVGLWGWYRGVQIELVERGIVRVPEPEGAHATEDQTEPAREALPYHPTTETDQNLEELLRPLAESVLRDLSQQLNRKDERRREGVER